MPRTTPQTDEPHHKRTQEAIENTLQTMRNNGKHESYIKTTMYILQFLNDHTDLFNSEGVKKYIAEITISKSQNKQQIGKPISRGTQRRYAQGYDNFCTANQIPFDKPQYTYKAPIPLIPKVSDVETIVSGATKRFSTIFAILSETGAEGEELHLTTRKQIDTQQGTISIIGVKNHDNGTYKLKETTTEMLRQYLAKTPETENNPFPTSKTMGNMWRRIRKKQAQKLCRPELNKIEFKNLRNYAGAIFYLTKGKDPIQTMHFMRHKMLETTMDYLRGLTEFTANAEYITKTVKTGEPNTVQQITELLNQGFKKEDEAEGYHFYRKLKY